MKKLRSLSVLCLLITVSCLPLLAGCTEKPWDLKNVIWYSDDPVIEVPRTETHIGFIKNGAETIVVWLTWGSSNKFSFYEYIEGATSYHGDDALLKGTLTYKKGVVILTINVNNIANFDYDTITLKSRKAGT